jgi:hypothetical protein
MDETQRNHESDSGKAFVRWFNQRNGIHFRFDSRPHEAPDQRYVDGSNILNIEITDAYYDKLDAEMQWKTARKESDAPDSWTGGDVDRSLVSNINKAITKKCANDYGKNCVLLVTVRPALTSGDEMEQLLPEIKIPRRIPFTGMYLMGDFPWTESCRGGFRCWQLL